MAISDSKNRTICEMCGSIYSGQGACPKCGGSRVTAAVMEKWGTDAQALLAWALDCREGLRTKSVPTEAFRGSLERVATLSARIFFLLNQPPPTTEARVPLDPKTEEFELEDDDEDDEDDFEEDE